MGFRVAQSYVWGLDLGFLGVWGLKRVQVLGEVEAEDNLPKPKILNP